MVEALAPPAVRLIDEIGLISALVAAGAVTVDGFINRFHDGERPLDGLWMHVERRALADKLLAAAQHRGAVISSAVATTSCDAGVFVDATGRAARWSRPVRRARPAVATLFAGTG